MPSSSGGGFGGGFSGGGGNFNGGFHSSGGNGGNNRLPYSNKAFPGATRYHYINSHGTMCFFYYAGTPTRVGRSGIVSIAIILAIALIIASIIPAFIIPRKISSHYCHPTDSYYIDNAGIVSNAEALNTSFSAFYEKTGIQPVLYTLKADDFPSRYGTVTQYSLEDFAYDLYLDLFSDEGHWLIVFVEFDKDPYFGWIDMHGDNTETVINDGFFEGFQNDMQTYLNSSSYTYEQAIVKAFDNATESSLKINSSIRTSLIMFSIIALLILAAIIYALVNTIKQRLTINGYVDYIEKHPEEKERSKEPDPTKIKDEDIFK